MWHSNSAASKLFSQVLQHTSFVKLKFIFSGLRKMKYLFNIVISLAVSQIFLTSLAFAQAVTTTSEPALAQPSFSEVLARMAPMFVIVFFIFYFLVMKPQQAKLKSHLDLIKSLKKGDNVVTSGGMIARVAGIEKDYILLEIAPNVRLKFEAAHISKKVDSEAANSKSSESKAVAS